MPVLQALVDLYLDQQLVSLPLVVDGLLGDDLCCVELAVFVGDSLIALGESSSA
jgi:hypothetical protein